MNTRQIALSITATTLAIAGLGVAGGEFSSAGATATAKHLAYFEKNATFAYTSPNGTTTSGPPHGAPKPGSRITFTDLNFTGTHHSHSAQWSATDHFVCAFHAKAAPTCDGEIAVGGSMLIVHGHGGQGTFTLPVVSGTGVYRGARGSLKVSDIGETLNANLHVSLSKL